MDEVWNFTLPTIETADDQVPIGALISNEHVLEVVI